MAGADRNRGRGQRQPARGHFSGRARGRPPYLFANPEGEAAQRFFAFPKDPAERTDALAQFIWAQACTGKFVWPVPDRGLKNRTHRIAAPTLIIWGSADRIIAPAYAQD